MKRLAWVAGAATAAAVVGMGVLLYVVDRLMDETTLDEP